MCKSQQSVKRYGVPVLVALLVGAFTGCGPDESLGQSQFDIAVQDQGSLILPNMSVDMRNYVVSLPLNQVPAVLCADCKPDQAERLQSHYRGEPLIPAATPVHLTPERFGRVDKRYFF